MTDVHEPEVRSYNMSRIRSKDTKPEMLVRRFLHKHGFRYRLHVKDLPGKPDIVLLKYKTVIFIHGCFWHGHENCKKYVVPKTRTEWWLQKINRNKANDVKNELDLFPLGWNVIKIYECELTKLECIKTLDNLISKIVTYGN
jgi:DNA mismatch endonuclease (patch repair protein)